MTSHPGSMVPEDHSEVKPPGKQERHTTTRWADLAALVVTLIVPPVLVIVGHAQAAVIVACGEFVTLVLRAWWRGSH